MASRRVALIGLGGTALAAWVAIFFAIAVAMPLASAEGGAVAKGSDSGAVVPRGDLLVSSISGHLRVVDRRGHLGRRLDGRFGRFGPQAMALAPDRRHAFISVPRGERSPVLYEVSLATGRRLRIGGAISPALSPSGRRLAFIGVQDRNGITYKTELVVEDLRTGEVRSIRIGSGVVMGTPPDNTLSWSPSERRIAIEEGIRTRLVDVATASTVSSQPALPKGAEAAGYLREHLVVALVNCCGGPSRLDAIDPRSGAERPFATISSPPEGVERLNRRHLLIVDAETELAVVSRDHVRVIAKRIAAATA